MGDENSMYQKKNQNYYWWTLVDPNKGCSYTEGSTGYSRTSAFVWVGLDCICLTISTNWDQ